MVLSYDETTNVVSGLVNYFELSAFGNHVRSFLDLLLHDPFRAGNLSYFCTTLVRHLNMANEKNRQRLNHRVKRLEGGMDRQDKNEREFEESQVDISEAISDISNFIYHLTTGTSWAQYTQALCNSLLEELEEQPGRRPSTSDPDPQLRAQLIEYLRGLRLRVSISLELLENLGKRIDARNTMVPYPIRTFRAAILTSDTVAALQPHVAVR